MQLGINKCMTEYDVYVQKTTSNIILICSYFDALLIIDFGILFYLLRVQILNISKKIDVTPEKVYGEIIKRFKMEECVFATTPNELNLKIYKRYKDEIWTP